MAKKSRLDHAAISKILGSEIVGRVSVSPFGFGIVGPIKPMESESPAHDGLASPLCADCEEPVVGRLVRFGSDFFHPECLARVQGELADLEGGDDQLLMGE